MDNSYEFGVIAGKVLFYIILIAMIWAIVKLLKKLKIKLFSNATKEELKIYLFWVDFVEGISSIEEFRKKLKKIKSIKVYKNRFNNFYLTKSEASSQNKEVEEISIKDVLASQTYPLFLLERLERITLYGEEDFKNIKKSSKMIWTTIKDIVFFMIIDKDKIVYPKDYPQDNKFRFGYEKFFDKDGYIGIYDIENDKLALPFEYKYIQTFGNIVIVSKDEKDYFIYDLNTNETITKTNNTTSLPNNLKEKIDLSKIELIDYLKLFDTPQSKSDLQVVGLWGANVAVMEVPSQYEEIIEDSSIGTLEWNNYCSADIFNMSVELPVNFKKKNGDYVSLGINPKYLILEKEYRLRLCTIENLFCQNISKNEIELFPLDKIYTEYTNVRKNQDEYGFKRETNQALYLDFNTSKEKRIEILYEEVACQTAMLAYHFMERDSDELFDMRDYKKYLEYYYSKVPNIEENYIEYLKAYFAGLRESAIDDISGVDELEIIKQKCKEANLLETFYEYMKNDR